MGTNSRVDRICKGCIITLANKVDLRILDMTGIKPLIWPWGHGPNSSAQNLGRDIPIGEIFYGNQGRGLGHKKREHWAVNSVSLNRLGMTEFLD
ncbi:hypothetical protein CK203_051782 [Vitis vinifera]|uniref:Uncharacterized protein n=1 Tax=Vitis vinifera TaxID=29760 RepID=A0A438HG60_VITVI|nr:hypothetical protein CK203_051782 [Vitis vinifera]